MAERTQINFRVDNTLLNAIRDHCEAEGITQTEFITNALRSALGITSNGSDATQIYEIVAAQVEPIQEELAKLRVVVGESRA